MGLELSQENTKETVDTSRRNFLKIGMAAFGSTLLNNNIANEDVTKGKRRKDYEMDKKEAEIGPEIEDSVNELKAGLEQKYNFSIELVAAEIAATKSATAKDFTELRLIKKYEALLMLESTLAKYPTFIISKSGLKNLMITTKSGKRSNSDSVGFVTFGHLEAPERKDQPVLVIAYDWNSGEDIPEKSRLDSEFVPDSLYEEYVSEESKITKISFEQTIHHEFFHFLVDMPGTESSSRSAEYFFTNKWSDNYGDFNDRKKEEYEKVIQEQSENKNEAPAFHTITEDTAGFAVPYGLTSDKEDRASVVEILLSGYEAYLIRDKTDIILHQKVASIKEFYFNLSNGLMDDEYWEDLRLNQKFSPAVAEFTEKAHGIIKTPYEEYIFKDRVSSELYADWQNRLKIEYPN
ncbi:hypothetical protein A3I99_02105 [Candidatus Kaiserbacteria bacterium RIFCSPLOWO2_02_FULL_45_11b]|uniref:Uncharacterized protein n=1 Tax=Candidatus Kaiserbacteria bacterium RIFCSPLOWO2_12_FULL_45_26 TaxID=1798525 RepID=A0A1F6FHN5_9BACT|nr:MAG: hypothetical protein A2Z56_04755 [Candidatus Kaiserbacteria bacterium RIFCSPHIGHO2_12_45_16]OGG70190.1 MAG: hypothetical protein A2929_03850 [Candidatus Kaiserbacteria bacterium RIFCSPLOWO2_01_FULL_45_25]OGG81857.1 MAG: hypothetical protein A3I99_02105 [Candidatus Kaiserbacteria bacterium RIFCSPLOWO2_02_FULL_45_11b]OGG85361.1 MAG: hypothetical protein A3G90_04910 [Candidatus Kaiserbacteria bacterium RIFCSPLOWO2_12_FULL_45_26]